MTDLIQRAEALEAQARTKDTLAAMNRADATDFRAEAAKLREQAREPLRLWVNVGGDMLAAGYPNEAEAKWRARHRTRIAVPMVEVRPGYALVKVPTDEEILLAMRQVPGCSYGSDFCRLFIEALGLRDSLAGVEVEK